MAKGLDYPRQYAVLVDDLRRTYATARKMAPDSVRIAQATSLIEEAARLIKEEADSPPSERVHMPNRDRGEFFGSRS